MITALIWLMLTGFTAWILHRHSMFASAMPALAVLAWWAAACAGLGLVVARVKRASVRAAAKANAERDALIREVNAEIKRQQEGWAKGVQKP